MYKVKISKNSRARGKCKCNNGQKTLRQLKKSTPIDGNKGLTIEPLKAQMKKRNVKRAHSKKAVQKRKRKSDKCYRPSCHLQWYKLTRQYSSFLQAHTCDMNFRLAY